MGLIKIFITTPWFHPAFRAGGPIQSVTNLVNEFSEGIEYYIFCGNTDLNKTPLENIETDKWVSYNPHTWVWYASPNKRSETLVKLLEKLKPDILYIIGVFSWHFNIVPLLFGKASRKIISARGMLHQGALSQKKIKKKLFLSIWKLFNWHRNTFFHATDELELKQIERSFGEIRSFVAGNFPRRFTQHIPAKKSGRLQLVSVALISSMKNHLLILQAFEQSPAVIEYHIFGPVKEMEYWQKCLEQMKQLPVNIAVEYHGEIMPTQVEEKLHTGHVFILPSKSENYGHAFYEALTAGKPVITSHNTPWQDLKAEKAGVNVGTNIHEIAEAIVFFANMPQEEFDQWSDGAVKYAKSRLDIEAIKDQYRIMFSLDQQKLDNSNPPPTA